MLEVKRVTKTFGDFTAISELDFTVEAGSIYGLVGYNGAGKTTLLKTIAGVYMADGGQVLIDGEDIFDNAAKKQRIFYVPDDLYFKPYASMKKMADFYNGYYPDFSFETFEKLSEAFGLDRSSKINGFSKGMQRQAEIILGMATTPRLLLLDESFDGLDPQKRELVKNLVIDYVKEKSCAVIISSHNLHELEDLCDNVGLINGKKLVMNCSIGSISEGQCKIRLAGNAEYTDEELRALDIDFRDLKRDGKIISFIVSGDIEETEKKINAVLKPLFIEKIPLSLNEIFLEKMEGTDYDFAEIFK